MFNNFLAPAYALEIVLKLTFCNDSYRHFALGVCTAASDATYDRPFSSPPNCAYGMSLRPSVPEQSTQDRSAVNRFFDPANFPVSNIESMTNNGARDHVPIADCRSQGVLILMQCIFHLRLPHAKIWQHYLQ